jgi:hypothetical protein
MFTSIPRFLYLRRNMLCLIVIIAVWFFISVVERSVGNTSVWVKYMVGLCTCTPYSPRSMYIRIRKLRYSNMSSCPIIGHCGPYGVIFADVASLGHWTSAEEVLLVAIVTRLGGGLCAKTPGILGALFLCAKSKDTKFPIFLCALIP